TGEMVRACGVGQGFGLEPNSRLISEAKAMKATIRTRRAFSAVALLGIASLAAPAATTGVHAQQKTIKLGMTVPLTGADAEGAIRIKNGAMIAIDEANANGGGASYKIDFLGLDPGTAT